MPVEPTDGTIQERFAAHVAAVLARSRIPKRDRADVAEELLGHLAERHAALVETGLTSDAAADEALQAFGGAAELGAAFVTAYHSRLWASTIGALLPVDPDATRPPGPVTWTIWLFRVLAVFSFGAAAVFLATNPPVRALAGATLAAVGAACLLLIAEGLRRRQAWTVGLAFLALVIEIGTFLATLHPSQETWNVNLFGVAAAVLLVAWIVDDAAVGRWMTGTAPIRGVLLTAMAIGLIGWGFAGVVGASFPDPTQIGPEDIEAVASVTCAPLEMEDGHRTVPVPAVTVDVVYHRADLWPAGILRPEATIGDPVGANVSHADAELIGGELVDTVTGESQGGWVIAGMNPDVPDGRTAATIPLSMQQSGHPLRVTMAATSNIGDGRPDAGTPLPGGAIDVRLGHLDRFYLGAHVACGERKALVPGGDWATWTP